MERTKQLQQQSSEVIYRLTADPKKDIQNERAKASFNPRELGVIIHGSEERIKRNHELIEMLASDPNFDKEERFYVDREGLYKMTIRLVTSLRDMVFKKGITNQEDINILSRSLALPSAADLHFGMFLPTILGQGTEAQKEKYLMPAIKLQIFGTYAQTELGHGTFLRGLETTATYDKSTQEFIIHSPTVTSTKWWPGGLAKTANHVVLMARLFIDGKDHGPHAFIVQIRSMIDHMPLPGIEIGDIGPKIGFNSVDNGYLRFDHYRIPRDCMLMKNSEVTPSGEYVAKVGGKASYGTMVFIRSLLVMSASFSLGKAVTIATRYSAVRRQTAPSDGVMESQVIDYQTQQNAIFPYIATTFALLFTGRFMKGLFEEFQKDSKSGNLGRLPEVHATSAGLKALVTATTADGIEICRKACGGHGFSDFSGLTILYQDYVGSCTYEGENTVLHLQTARYLLKVARQGLSGKKLEGDCKYLENPQGNGSCPAQKAEDLYNPEIQLEAFRRRAAHIIFGALRQIKKNVDSGMSEEDARNAVSIDLVKCSRAHCQYILAVNFVNSLASLPNSPSKVILQRLCNLFIFHTIENDMGEFLASRYLNVAQIEMIQSSIKVLLAQIRPDAVSIVDSFMYHDYELCSALGKYDGDVYNDLLRLAKKSVLNKTQVGPAYEPYLKKRFVSKL